MAQNSYHIGGTPPFPSERYGERERLTVDSLRETIAALKTPNQNLPCGVSGHVVDVAYGDEPIEYLDGLIAAYCKNCKCRIVFPKIEGGLGVEWVKALAGQVLAGEFTETLWADFIAAADVLAHDKEAVDAATSTVELVREVIGHRLRNG